MIDNIELNFEQDLKTWEESLKYEGKIYKEKARFFAEMYEKNFGQEIVENFQVVDFGLISSRNPEAEDKEEIGIIIGGNFGYIYSIPINLCFQPNSNYKKIQGFFQAHMNT